MALNVTMQLANSEGLMRILVFTGLRHAIVVRPTIHGEPILTAQAFYYLEELESVATLRYENNENELTEEALEYLIDNYLFEYSKIDSKSKMTCKVTKGKFWKDSPREMYVMADQTHTEALALDLANDPYVKSIEAIDSSDQIDLTDWRIGHNFAATPFSQYLDSLCNIIDKKVLVSVMPSEFRDGYIGKLRVLKCGAGLIDFFQGDALENIAFRDILPAMQSFPLAKSKSQVATTSLPITRINTIKEHTPILLSHYFAGLKDDSYLKSFAGYYNVLEYYFEEAPLLQGKTTKTERDQLLCVLQLLTTDINIKTFISELDPKVSKAMFVKLPTSSGIFISEISITSINDYCLELSRWLYEIRCAIVHSKKTRNGKPTATFEPYSHQAKNVATALPIIKWLSILCIEKDYELRNNP